MCLLLSILGTLIVEVLISKPIVADFVSCQVIDSGSLSLKRTPNTYQIAKILWSETVLAAEAKMQEGQNYCNQ